jgi:hypothetical protein
MQTPQFEIPGSKLEAIRPDSSDQLPKPFQSEKQLSQPEAKPVTDHPLGPQFGQSGNGQQAQIMSVTQPVLPTADDATQGSAADDVDVIEKEWVEKAKSILNHYSDDPLKEANELHKLKATYMLKRFNKVLKQADLGEVSS